MRFSIRLLALFWALFHFQSASAIHEFDRTLLGPIPENCYAIRKNRNTYNEEPQYSVYRFFKNLISYDVVCVGDVVEITEPMRTSGGHIIIYADKVKIAASLDTRPYFPRDAQFSWVKASEWTQYTSQSLRYVQQKTMELSTAIANSRKTAYKEAIIDYYEHCEDCLAGEKLKWAPEIHGGATPPLVTGRIYRVDDRDQIWRRRGLTLSEHAMEWQNLKSGDIWIFANQIDRSDEVKPGGRVLDPIRCDGSTSSRYPFALDASGIRGSRGGLGTPDPFLGNPYTEDKGDVGEVSANGGRGADGGRVALWQSQPAQAVYTDWQPHVSIAGGSKGSSDKIRPQEIYRFTAEKRNNRPPHCALTRIGKWNPSKNGTNGLLEVRSTNYRERFEQFIRLVAALDSQPSMDLIELAERSQTDPTIRHLSFMSFFSSQVEKAQQLLRELVLGEIELWLKGNSIQQQIDTGTTRRIKRTLGEPALGSPFLGERDRYGVDLLASSDLDSTASLLNSYLLYTGGLGSVSRKDTIPLVQQEAQYSQLLKSTAEISSLAPILAKIRTSLFYLENEKRKERKLEAISKVRAEISSLLTQSQPSKVEFSAVQEKWNVLNKKGKSLDAAWKKYKEGDFSTLAARAASEEEFLKIQDKATAAFGSVVVEGAVVAGGVVSLLKTATEFLSSPESPEVDRIEIAKLQGKLIETQNALDDFLLDSYREQRNLLVQDTNHLVKAMKARFASHAVAQVRAGSFDDLIRHIALGYLQSSARNETRLSRTLRELSDYVALGTSPSSGSVPEFFESCKVAESKWYFGILSHRQEQGCLNLPPSDSKRFVFATHKNARDRDREIILYVIDPTSTELILSDYGFDITRVMDAI